MGKRKGKARTYPTETGATSTVGPMDSFVVKSTPETPGNFPLGTEPEAGALELSPGLSTSLSPGERRCPPQPEHLLITPEETPVFPLPNGRDAASKNGGATQESLRTTEQQRTLAVESLTVPTEELEHGLAGKQPAGIKAPAEDTAMKLLADLSLKKPSVVTLDMLWDFLSQISKSLFPQITLTQQRLEQMEVTLIQHEAQLIKKQTETEKLQAELSSVKSLNENIMKDNISLRFKMETLENSLRATNLRMLNFPRLPLIGAKEMFKRYSIEILNVSSDKVPSLVRAYYLPTGKKEPSVAPRDQEPEMDTLNLTAFLEQSDSEQAVPSTMIVVFSTVSERDWYLRQFFRFREKSFLNLKINIFPDVSRDTQKRRKQFLSLKMAVLQLGAIYFLRFPCKCLVKYKSTRYIFHDPAQLSAFVSVRSCSTSTPKVDEIEGTTSQGYINNACC